MTSASDSLRSSIDTLRAQFGELRGRALWVVLGCMICQMGLGFTYVSRPLAPFLIEEWGLTRAAYSVGSVPQLLAQSLASPLVGFCVVRLGASRVLGFGAALFTAVFLYFAQIENLFGLYVAFAGVGLAAAAMGDVGVGHVVSRWTHRSRGLALGIAYAGSNLGGLLMAQLFIHVAAVSSWRYGLASIAAVALLLLLPVAIWLVREPDKPGEGATPDEPIAPGPRTDDAALEATALPPESNSLDLKAAIRTRSFWILTATLFTFFFYFQGILDHLLLFLVDTGMSRVDATFYFSQAVGLGIVSKLLGGLLADRVHPELAIRLDYALLALSSLVLLLLPGKALLWVFVATYGFAYPARDVAYPLVLARCFGVKYLGEIYGAMMLVLPAGALASLYAASIHDRLGSYDLAFQSFAGLNALALVGLFFLRDERPQSASPRARKAMPEADPSH